LVFCGCDEYRGQIIIFLSDTARKQYVKIYAHRDFNCRNQFAYFDATGQLILGDVALTTDSNHHTGYIANADTIVWVGKKLIELNTLKSYKKIDSLKITILHSPVSYIKGEYLTICSNGKTMYEKIIRSEGHDMSQKYRDMDADMGSKTILNIAERLPFYKYKEEYTYEIDDGVDWYTDIFFSDHSTISILDTMAIGPFGLQSIYQHATSLMKKSWKLISVRH
jgi:hypothetical protein